ncbi:MAG: methyltransferase domain-containing protein [Betaproteobacteria bacterium]
MTEFDSPREAWDARYRCDEYIFGTAPNVFLASQEKYFAAGTRVLAVADGEGRNGVWLAERGCKVCSVDISPIAIEKAKKLALERAANVEFAVADLMEWAWPESVFDVVVCIFIQFASPGMRKKLFDGFWRTLRPGGVVVMEGYGVKQLQYTSGGPGKLENLYTPEMLRDAFAEWDIRLLREYEAVLDEGARHRGMAALVDFVARKPD